MIARRMVDARRAFAVMGNHELNAVAWHTPDLINPGKYLRPHFSKRWGNKNRFQHAALLAKVEDKPELHREIDGWFLNPLGLEFGFDPRLDSLWMELLGSQPCRCLLSVAVERFCGREEYRN
jgi:hypothetical protein